MRQITRTSLSRAGFSLVEMMIVVTIIMILTRIMLPAIQRVHFERKVSLFINQLKAGVNALQGYYTVNSSWPPDMSFGQVVPGMSSYIQDSYWTNRTPIGEGVWDYERFGAKVGGTVTGTGTFIGLAVYSGMGNPNGYVTDDYMQEVDRRIDDGDFNTGMFRKRTSGRFDYFIWMECYSTSGACPL